MRVHQVRSVRQVHWVRVRRVRQVRWVRRVGAKVQCVLWVPDLCRHNGG